MGASSAARAHGASLGTESRTPEAQSSASSRARRPASPTRQSSRAPSGDAGGLLSPWAVSKTFSRGAPGAEGRRLQEDGAFHRGEATDGRPSQRFARERGGAEGGTPLFLSLLRSL
eukprot:scaffold273674_cov31-Tisochrysis_lutea.AAC.3